MLLLPQIYFMRPLFYLCLLFVFANSYAQNYPLGYVEQFNAVFTPTKFSSQFIYSSSTAVKVANKQCHVSFQADTVKPLVPNSMILIENLVLGDFITSISVMTKSLGEDTLGGLFLVSGIRDSSNYYLLQFNQQGAFFHKMYKNKLSLIAADSNFVLPHQVWLDLTIKRDILKRTLVVEYKNQKTEFYDPNLVMGYLGLGTVATKFSIKKWAVWAPTSIEKPTLLFKPVVHETEPQD